VRSAFSTDLSFHINAARLVKHHRPQRLWQDHQFSNIIAGLSNPSVSMHYRGEEIESLRGGRYMMQKELLFPWRTVLGMCAREGTRAWTASEAEGKAVSISRCFGLSASRMTIPKTLSCGTAEKRCVDTHADHGPDTCCSTKKPIFFPPLDTRPGRISKAAEVTRSRLPQGGHHVTHE